eukprot:4867983-Prorocentrum_lima.AAC.1
MRALRPLRLGGNWGALLPLLGVPTARPSVLRKTITNIVHAALAKLHEAKVVPGDEVDHGRSVWHTSVWKGWKRQ